MYSSIKYTLWSLATIPWNSFTVKTCKSSGKRDYQSQDLNVHSSTSCCLQSSDLPPSPLPAQSWMVHILVGQQTTGLPPYPLSIEWPSSYTDKLACPPLLVHIKTARTHCDCSDKWPKAKRDSITCATAAKMAHYTFIWKQYNCAIHPNTDNYRDNWFCLINFRKHREVQINSTGKRFE